MTTTATSYIDSLKSGASGTSSTSSSSKSKGTIDQAGFLSLLTAQLKTQDPTEPTDNAQMAAQMAQFSTVAGISEMNTSLKSMATDLAASRFGDASGWIGRNALVTSSTAGALANGAFAGQIALPTDATDVTLSLVDANGSTVHAEDLGAHAAGNMDWGWDGKDASGAAVAGPLQVVVGAKGASGSITPALSTWSEIQSVQSPTTGTTKLVTGLGNYSPGEVQELS